jgi:putative endopeptidase
MTDEELRLRINTDSHSPGRFRAIGPPSNMIEFAEAFGGKDGEPMVRTDRIIIW